MISVSRLQIFVSVMVLAIAPLSRAQAPPVSFEQPRLGYVFSPEEGTIRAISGILGNAVIEAPLPIPIVLERATLLPDQRSAIAVADGHAEALLIDLPSLRYAPLPRVPATFSMVHISGDGAVAAFYYPDRREVLIISGLPEAPVVSRIVDMSFGHGELTRLAVANDGQSLLAAFTIAAETRVYRWSPDSNAVFLRTIGFAADIELPGVDAIIADATTGEVFWFADVMNAVAPFVAATHRDGLSQPQAIFVLPGRIYVGDANGTIVVLDETGRVLRTLSCACSLTNLTPLGSSAIQLTDRLDRPVLVLDASEVTDRLLFIPARADAAGGSR